MGACYLVFLSSGGGISAFKGVYTGALCAFMHCGSQTFEKCFVYRFSALLRFYWHEDGRRGQCVVYGVDAVFRAVCISRTWIHADHSDDYKRSDQKRPFVPDFAKKAVLDYEVLNEVSDERTSTGKRILVRIQLGTGRHHQIRVQMAHAGMPLLGDRKYNPEDSSGLPLGLCSCHLVFLHPITGKKMEFQVTPKGNCFAGFPNI